MRILITGGSGFIGSHLADRLLARGDTVAVVDNFATGRRDNLVAHPNLTIFEGTIADHDFVAQIFAQTTPEIVVHAAASYKDPENWTEDTRTNVLGTAHIVQIAKQANVRRIIYFQTALCYGIRPLEQPITLNHPIRPGDSSYAISKTAGEQYIELSGMNYISFRLANAYGPRNLSGPLPTFFHRLTNGKPCFVTDTRRDFIFVQDLIDCVIPAIDGAGQSGKYHISSGSDYSIQELFNATVRALQLDPAPEVELRPRGTDDAPTILLSPMETERAFGWSVRTPLEVGVAAAIDYYKQYGITQTYTHLKLGEKA